MTTTLYVFRNTKNTKVVFPNGFSLEQYLSIHFCFCSIIFNCRCFQKFRFFAGCLCLPFNKIQQTNLWCKSKGFSYKIRYVSRQLALSYLLWHPFDWSVIKFVRHQCFWHPASSTCMLPQNEILHSAIWYNFV